MQRIFLVQCQSAIDEPLRAAYHFAAYACHRTTASRDTASLKEVPSNTEAWLCCQCSCLILASGLPTSWLSISTAPRDNHLQRLLAAMGRTPGLLHRID